MTLSDIFVVAAVALFIHATISAGRLYERMQWDKRFKGLDNAGVYIRIGDGTLMLAQISDSKDATEASTEMKVEELVKLHRPRPREDTATFFKRVVDDFL